MEISKQTILASIYTLCGLTIEGFILWLFPFTGLGGFICWPTAILLSLGFGYVLFKLSKRQLKNWQTLIAFLILILLQTIIQISTIPQEIGGNAFSKISDAKDAFAKFDKIEFNDFPGLTRGERVAYLYKFKRKPPHTFITLTIDSLKNTYESSNPRTYLIQSIAGRRVYDKSKIKLIESDTATVIIEYYDKKDTLVYKMNRNFMNIGSGGYNNGLISLDIYEDNLKLDTGIEKLFYVLLGWTKKANH